MDTYLQQLVEKGVPLWKALNQEIEERLVKFATSPENEQERLHFTRKGSSFPENREIIGTIIIRTNERYFSNIYRNIDMGTDADIFIIDSDGIVVSSRNSSITVAKQYKNPNLIDELLDRQKRKQNI